MRSAATPETQRSEPIAFRCLTHGDLAQIHAWLHTPHVARWYEDLDTLKEVSEQYGAYVTGEEPVEPYMALYANHPIGYIQIYRVKDNQEYGRLVSPPNSVRINVFTGEEELLYQGLEPLVIRGFIESVVFAEGSVATCIIDPEPENAAAIRAYKKAGSSIRKQQRPSGGRLTLWSLRGRGFA